VHTRAEATVVSVELLAQLSRLVQKAFEQNEGTLMTEKVAV
jgi:hypothetical protein